jgi:diazepam-binding inhibitor (GABA receptor modulator, acyl-CoA-binding protein)
MATTEEFENAARRVQNLPQKPGNDTLLELYGLYKQASEGDVSTKRPGMLDIKGRAKWDAWSSRKGLSKDDARDKYVALVQRLER